MVRAIYDKRESYAEVAESERLDDQKYRGMIWGYAKAFAINPDKVFKFTSFDTVTTYLLDQKELSEYADRYNEHERIMNILNNK